MEKIKLNIQLFASGESEVFTDSPLQMKITWESTAGTATENSSSVTARIYGRRTSSSTKGRQWNGYLNIGGNVHNFSEIYTSTSTSVGTSWVLMEYFTDTIAHNNDGTKTITISGGLGGPSGTSLASKYAEGSVSATLDTIARGGILTNVTLNSNFIANGKFTPTFTTPVSGRYYAMALTTYSPLDIIQSWNSPITGIQSGVEAQLSSTALQKLWAFLDSNNNTANLSFVLYTYADSSYTNPIMNTSVQKPNATAIPSYSLTWTSHAVQDIATTQYGGHPISYYANGKFVKYLSIPQLTFSAASSTGTTYGKTISYSVNGVNANSPYSESNWTGSGYNVIASDGRTSSISWSTNMTVVDYILPTISNVVVKRPTPTVGTVKVSYTATYYNGTGLTNLSNAAYDFYYKENENDNWTKISSLSGTGTSGTQTYSEVSVTGLNYKKPFYYKIELTDRIGKTADTYSGSIPKGEPVWNAYTDSSDENILNVNGKLTIDNLSISSKTSLLNLIYPVGSVYMSVVDVSPQTFFGGTWTRISGQYILTADSNGGTTGGSSTSGGSSAANTGSTALTIEHIPYGLIWVEGNQPGKVHQEINSMSVGGGAFGKMGRAITSGQGHSHSMAHTHSIEPPWIKVYCWKRTA